MKKFFPRLTVKDICILGLLIAVTVILAVLGTFRIGNAIKIPTKFISIFVTATLYGPFYGGLVAVLGDLFNCLLAPSGVFLPQITALEFLNGFIFGIFFFKNTITAKSYAIRNLLCAMILFVVDIFLTGAVLVSVGIFPNFAISFATRIWAGIIKFVLHIAVIFAFKNFTNKLRRLKNE